jgi:hypothetical protein
MDDRLASETRTRRLDRKRTVTHSTWWSSSPTGAAAAGTSPRNERVGAAQRLAARDASLRSADTCGSSGPDERVRHFPARRAALLCSAWLTFGLPSLGIRFRTFPEKWTRSPGRSQALGAGATKQPRVSRGRGAWRVDAEANDLHRPARGLRLSRSSDPVTYRYRGPPRRAN